ncbi:MAG: porin [Nitrospiria bacterium]
MVKKRILSILLLSALISLFHLSAGPISMAQSADTQNMSYGSPASFAEFHGFLNMTYYDMGNQLGSAPPSGLDLRDFYLSAKSQLRQNITLFGEIEVESGVFKLDRAFIDLHVQPLINFQFGKFFTPFGIDKMESVQAPFNKLVSVPLPLVEIGYEDWSDVGAQLYGQYSMNPAFVAYNLAVMKGSAGFTETDLANTENNRNKMVYGRLKSGLLSSDGTRLTVGASAGYGKYDDASQNVIRLFGTDAIVNWRGFDLRGEYMVRSGDDSTLAISCNGTNTPGNCTIARASAEGYYIQLSYLLLKDLPGVYSLEPVVRFDKSDLADHFAPLNPDTAARRATIGINYAPYDHFHVKGEYQFVRNDGTDLHNDGMMLSVVADF